MWQRVTVDELYGEFKRVLHECGFSPQRTDLCARIYSENTRDGVLSHGINRFPEFIDFVRRGLVKVNAEPALVFSAGALERWDGQQGAGIVNAHFSMGRAIELAAEHTLGCVALRNTNHWMRPGAYGLQAADAGCIGICWTNTKPLMPPWGGREPKVGNNPLVVCVPHEGEHLLLDMSMSQFSFGRMLIAQRTGEKLPVPGGFDEAGQLTDDAGAILRSQRPLPIGYWKGSGLALVLDCVASVLAAGQATFQVGAAPDETNCSQIFMAIDLERAGCAGYGKQLLEQLLGDLHATPPLDPEHPVSFPGERMRRRREISMAQGIEVDAEIWRKVREL